MLGFTVAPFVLCTPLLYYPDMYDETIWSVKHMSGACMSTLTDM